ncbi:hypothetical protein GCN78_10350 [Janthinobacterium rivuli]|uniref:HEPN domain-containing protein n=1 Tax=Janthinobacterium sp. FT68W TaxID=2654255 RepID=UPI0012641C4B|nr:HEPN domain-containing protein [Janthinobacterium sp. FT68W]KAB8052209.1 hypothetical protein GCN78_10350 [Janthinobacterium sp. FT68W]
MANSAVCDKYIAMYEALKGIIAESQQRVVSTPPDNFFIDNMNFFVKAYLINMCTYMESYLQEICLQHSKKITDRVLSANIPHNFLHWKFATKKHKEKDFEFSPINIVIEKREISDELSANVYKTSDVFRNLGIDLSTCAEYVAKKDIIKIMVTKRNNIIHHNDGASDVTLNDLLNKVDDFLAYMIGIDTIVLSQ